MPVLTYRSDITGPRVQELHIEENVSAFFEENVWSCLLASELDAPCRHRPVFFSVGIGDTRIVPQHGLGGAWRGRFTYRV